MNRTKIGPLLLSVIVLFSACAKAARSSVKPDGGLPASSFAKVSDSAADSVKEERKGGYVGFEIKVRAFTTNEGQTTFSHPTITEVRKDSPADKAGMQIGDVILESNGKDARLIGALFPEVGVKMIIRIRRGDVEQELLLVPIARVTKFP